MSFTVCRLFHVSRYKWEGAEVRLVDEAMSHGLGVPSFRHFVSPVCESKSKFESRQRISDMSQKYVQSACGVILIEESAVALFIFVVRYSFSCLESIHYPSLTFDEYCHGRCGVRDTI